MKRISDGKLGFFAATACILMLWVLLPLIPAVLIYRLFPDTPIGISGILQGLKINAGGAFAGYLIVLLVIKPWVSEAYIECRRVVTPGMDNYGISPPH
jgi:hypothetical protein